MPPLTVAGDDFRRQRLSLLLSQFSFPIFFCFLILLLLSLNYLLSNQQPSWLKIKKKMDRDLQSVKDKHIKNCKSNEKTNKPKRQEIANQKEEKIRNCHPEIFRLGVEEPRWHPDLPCMPLDSRSAALIIGIQIYRTCGRNPDLLLIQPTSRSAMFLLREEQVVGRHDGH